MVQCPGCGAEVAHDDVFCRKCGRRLNDQTAPPVPARDAFMDDMAADFHQKLKHEPDNADAIYNIGLALMYSQRFADAAECFERVVAIMPDFGDAHVKLVTSLARSSRREEARGALARGLEKLPAHEPLQRLQELFNQAESEQG